MLRHRNIKEPLLPVLLAYARLAGISTDELIDDDLDLPQKISSKPYHKINIPKNKN